MPLEDILKNLRYDPTTGNVHLRTPTGISRSILPDVDGMVSTSIQGKKLKIKYSNLVWCLYKGVRPTKDQVVHHKDLDTTNFRAYNLMLITRAEHFAVLEATKNLTGALRIIPHPTDAFSYVLEYKSKGRPMKEVFSDITLARKKLLKLQLYYIKIVGKYTLTA